MCSSADLVDGGNGVRFDVQLDLGQRRELTTGFVVRFKGKVHGWLNQCQHVPMELDWQPGQFFADEGRLLVCSTHGAMYEPDSGWCVSGPCRGKRLRRIQVVEIDGEIRWIADAFVLPL